MSTGKKFIDNSWQKVLNLQQKYLLNSKIKKDRDAIVMLVPDKELISGGILSIYSLYYATLKITKKKSVFICTYPNKPSLFRYKWFENEVVLINFDYIIKNIHVIDSLLIHIPECYVAYFLDELRENQKNELRKIDFLHINVMNQNNELMPTVEQFNRLKEIATHITMTTAHISYTTQQLRSEYKVPVHLLSAWFEQKEIIEKPFKEKKDIIIVSPDEHPYKERILDKLKRSFPDVKQIIIKNMKYDVYKELESVAKWSISFGEGFDGYTIFPVLKGGVSFAVYNETFFTQEYKDVKTFYSSYDDMELSIVDDIRNLNNTKNYEDHSRLLRNKLKNDYGYTLYLNKVKDFYSNKYTLP